MKNASHQRNVKRRAAVWLSLGLIPLLVSPLAAQPFSKRASKQVSKQSTKQGDQEGAKQLFYNPATGAASQPGQPGEKARARSGQSRILARQTPKAQHPGIHYWIELEGVGKVTDDHVFHTGDRIKLRVRSNVAGYLSLWAYDPSGESQLLFPSSDRPEDNQITANSLYTLPGSIEFKPPAEDERLLIFFSQSPDDTPQPKTGRLTALQAQQATEPEGGKALLFEVEKKDKERAGTYVVNQRGGAIAKEIRLKHRPLN